MGTDDFKNNLNLLLSYRSLLKKKRSTLSKKEIERVLCHQENVFEIISLIQKIDKNFLEKKNFLPKYENDLVFLEEEIDSQQTAFSIKETKRFSIVRYLLKSKKELAGFLEESRFFERKFFSSYFPLKMESSSFLKELQKLILNLGLPITKTILESGWKQLAPVEYNLFYVLHEFFTDYLHRFQNTIDSLENNFLFLEGILKNFLTIYNVDEALKRLKRSAASILDYNDDETIDYLFFLEKIFSCDDRLSFVQYIIEIYSVYYRKILTLENLSKWKNVKSLEIYHYLTTYKVGILKKQFLKNLKNIQNQQEKNLFMLKYISEQGSSEIKDFVFGVLKEELNTFPDVFCKGILYFFESFLLYFKGIFLEEITIEDYFGQKKRIRIFEKIWDASFWSIENYLHDLKERMSEEEDCFSLAEYKKFLNDNAVCCEKRKKAAVIIQKIVWETSLMFELLLHFLYSDYILNYTEDQETLLALLQVRHIPITEKSTERLIPYSEFKAEEYGKTIKEILEKAISLLGNFLYIIDEKFIVDKVNLKDFLLEKNQENIKKILQYNLL